MNEPARGDNAFQDRTNDSADDAAHTKVIPSLLSHCDTHVDVTHHVQVEQQPETQLGNGHQRAEVS